MVKVSVTSTFLPVPLWTSPRSTHAQLFPELAPETRPQSLAVFYMPARQKGMRLPLAHDEDSVRSTNDGAGKEVACQHRKGDTRGQTIGEILLPMRE